MNASMGNRNDEEKCLEKYKTFYNWSKVNWNKIKSFLLHTDWNDYFEECVNADQYYDTFCCVLQSKLIKYYPKLLRKLLARKALLWREYKDRRTARRKEALTGLPKDASI